MGRRAGEVRQDGVGRGVRGIGRGGYGVGRKCGGSRATWGRCERRGGGGGPKWGAEASAQNCRATCKVPDHDIYMEVLHI